MSNTSSGTAGSVVLVNGGTAVIGEISEWTANLTQQTNTRPAFGRNWQRRTGSIRDITGSFSMLGVPSDTQHTQLRNAMLGGSCIELRLYETAATYINVPSVFLPSSTRSQSITGDLQVTYNFELEDGTPTYV